MRAGYSFRPRAWAAALAALACGAGIALGNWQAERAEGKRARGAELERALREPPLALARGPIDARAYAMRRVAARGRFVGEHTVYLDNKLRRGRAGYEVVTPLKLNGAHVLVNRGWVPAPARRERLPEVPTPAGEVEVAGLALERLPRALPLGAEASGRLRQNLELEAFGKETGLELLPIVIEQHSPAPDGLLREWPQPQSGVPMHESYALQWYSLAALAVILFLALSFRRAGEA